jgi:hypothetical protein
MIRSVESEDQPAAAIEISSQRMTMRNADTVTKDDEAENQLRVSCLLLHAWRSA